MKRWLYFTFVTVALFWVSCSGCHSIPVSPASFNSVHGFKLYGTFTWQEVSELDKLVSVLPKPVIESIEFIAKIDGPWHFGGAAGHCNIIGKICIKGSYINNCSIVWHEIAHAYTFKLREHNFTNLEKEWKDIAGKVYFGDDERLWEYPKDGLITSYGRTDWLEDIAEYTREFYLAITGCPSVFTRLTKEMRLEDKRYEEKLKLLLKYNFFTQSDYQKLYLKLSD